MLLVCAQEWLLSGHEVCSSNLLVAGLFLWCLIPPLALAAKRLVTWYILVIGSLSLWVLLDHTCSSCSVIDPESLLACITGEPGPCQRAGSELFGPRALVWLGSPRTTADIRWSQKEVNSKTRDDSEMTRVTNRSNGKDWMQREMKLSQNGAKSIDN